MTQPLAAFVLTQSAFAVEAAVVARKVGERFAHLGIRAEVHGAAPPGSTHYAIAVDGLVVTVRYAGELIPQDLLTGFAPHLFEAEPPSLAHRDRAIVMPLDDVAEGHAPTVRAALAVLRVAAILAEGDEATAVCWIPSAILMSAAFFTRVFAASAEPGEVPIALLNRFVPYEGEAEGGFESQAGIAVFGLHRFIGCDIEFTPTDLPITLVAQWALDASNWLLLKGPVFADGDTFGGSETEIIRIRHVEKGRISPYPVLALTIETLDPSDLTTSAMWSN